MLKTLILIILISLSGYSNAQTNSITYQWLNQWCGDIIDCDEGCMACNLPVNTSTQFFGTNVVWIGIDVCPHPIVGGDNAIGTFGWETEQSLDKYIMLSGLSTYNVKIDSIIFIHGRSVSGPMFVNVEFSKNNSDMINIDTVIVSQNFQTSVITNLGDLIITDQDPFGVFQIKFSPYGSNTGGWYLDEVRIVCSPSEISTNVEENSIPENVDMGPWYDVLGRPVDGSDIPPGIYINKERQRRIVVGNL